ncbi:MAG: hypothetical protein HOB40_01710 [Candidatus Marinimicrobia bacterium]|jgi:hypothetical protein|nr:hypothetical protein [Candidatus Neomarinimicrobiota bacterium]MBT3999015.1 hypothetical protein [Candidatus Neomarinimicrobiota bacterium]MBT4281977.1 hypothetical protein [Candidatus Neomarinimicrobiota bacterium]MBT4579385.1 hypothetical protein [Candidatus Neomarinimicrobiota bacterium]MBT4734957.1 hypothetical protein [Candidatus Neomarinimicrobiota bacterium]
MFDQAILNNVLGKGFDFMGIADSPKNGQDKRYNKIKSFLLKSNFSGFTKDDLFIMQFIKKGWGHDIAALSNMAEAFMNFSHSNPAKIPEYQQLLSEVVFRALHPKVNPYKKDIKNVKYLGKYGYYLEHLNIILGCYQKICGNEYIELNEKICKHLIANSFQYENFHADLLPHVKMKWSADQAAILYSIWLYDENNGTFLGKNLTQKWLHWMKTYGTHTETGLFITEVLGTRKYSNQPRGCAIAYLVHYMGRFSPKEAKEQWKLFKKHMEIRVMGKIGFREFLPDYDGTWSPDSGPIIMGVGIAATGLALNAASTIKDKTTFKALEKSMNPIYSLLSKGDIIPGMNMISKIGTDLLSSSIWLNAESK